RTTASRSGSRRRRPRRGCRPRPSRSTGKARTSAPGSPPSRAGAAPRCSCGAARSRKRSTRFARGSAETVVPAKARNRGFALARERRLVASLQLAQRLQRLRRIVRRVAHDEAQEILSHRHAVEAAQADAALRDGARDFRAESRLVAALDADAVDVFGALEARFLRCARHFRALDRAGEQNSLARLLRGT